MSETSSGSLRPWLVVVWILVGSGGLFATVMRPPATTLFLRELLNAGHGPLYTAFAFLLADTIFYSRFRPGLRRSLVAGFVGSLLVGILQESIQYFTPRDADLGDMLHNTLGSLAGIWIWAAWRDLRQRGRWRRRIVAVFGAFVLLAVVVAPAFALGFEQRARDRAMPTLFLPGSGWTEAFKFSQFGDLELVSPVEGFMSGVSNETVYRWNPWSNARPRAGMREVSPDWRPYRRLVTEWYLAGTSGIELGFRVNDHRHNSQPNDRYEVRRRLEPGFQRLEFSLEEIRRAPNGRALDLNEVVRVFFYLPEPTVAENSSELLPELYLGRWFLE